MAFDVSVNEAVHFLMMLNTTLYLPMVLYKFDDYYFYAHQHKAAGVKTKQSVKQRLQRLLIRCSLYCIIIFFLPSVVKIPRVKNKS